MLVDQGLSRRKAIYFLHSRSFARLHRSADRVAFCNPPASKRAGLRGFVDPFACRRAPRIAGRLLTLERSALSCKIAEAGYERVQFLHQMVGEKVRNTQFRIFLVKRLSTSS
jgi:hypothetical protein